MDVGAVEPATTRELRRSVLRPEFGPDDALPGDELCGAVHVAAVEDDVVLGTCFVYPEPCPWLPAVGDAWRLRQMATDPRHRGRGVGAAVLAGAIDVVRARGASLIWCHARESAAPFYARHGFRVHGERFVEHGLPHRRMWRELSAAPISSEQ